MLHVKRSTTGRCRDQPPRDRLPKGARYRPTPLFKRRSRNSPWQFHRLAETGYAIDADKALALGRVSACLHKQHLMTALTDEPRRAPPTAPSAQQHHPDHAPSDHARCAELAERHDLFLTAGSDHHGRFGSIPHLGFRIPAA